MTSRCSWAAILKKGWPLGSKVPQIWKTTKHLGKFFFVSFFLKRTCLQNFWHTNYATMHCDVKRQIHWNNPRISICEKVDIQLRTHYEIADSLLSEVNDPNSTYSQLVAAADDIQVVLSYTYTKAALINIPPDEVPWLSNLTNTKVIGNTSFNWQCVLQIKLARKYAYL